MVEVRYNINNSRFNNLYGDWDNANWLLPNEPQSVMNFTESVREQESPINQQVMMANIEKIIIHRQQ